MNQSAFLPMLFGILLLCMFGVVTLGIILFHRSRKRPGALRHGLRFFVFFVMELYLLLFAMMTLWCLGQIVTTHPGMWYVLSGFFLLLGEVAVWGWFAYRHLFPAGAALVEAKKDVAVEPKPEEGEQETTEARICRGLSDLFDKQCIYREFELHIEDVAMRIGTNRTYLSAVLNKKFGYNFLRFVNDYRLNEACELLKSTSLPVCRIADRVGYKNLNTFNSCFRERFGLPPKQWRIHQMEN